MNCARCGSPPETPSCVDCPTVALHPAHALPTDLDASDGKDGPAPIGGWLILAAVGLVISPFQIGYTVVGELLPLISGAQWELLTSPGSEAYRPGLAWLLLFEIVANGLLVAYTLVTCVAFFQRRRAAPRMMIAFWVAQLVLFLLDTVLVQFLVEAAPLPGPIALSVGVLKSVAWCAYYQCSIRVRRTFVR